MQNKLSNKLFLISKRSTKATALTVILLISIALPLLMIPSAAAAATVTLDKTSGPNGTSVGASGAGFGISETASAFTITVNGLSTKIASSTLKTNSTGGLSGSFVIGGAGPLNLAPGTYSIQISDSVAAPQAASFTITAPTVTLVPSSGPAGTSVLISASGFTTGSNQITAASFAGTTIYSQGTLSAFSGAVSNSTAIPPGTTSIGLTMTVASAALTNVTNKLPASIAPSIPWVGNGSFSASFTPVVTGASTGVTFTSSWSGTIGPESIGTSDLINGTLTVTVGSYTVTNSASALSSNKISSGSYTGTVSLPGMTSSTLPTFTLTDNFGNVAIATWVLNTPTVTLTPSSGPVGTQVTATAAGFGPGATVASVKIGNAAPLDTLAPLVPATPGVTEQGTTAFMFTVTAATLNANFAAGAQAITVTDSLGNVAIASFAITPTVTITLGDGATDSGVAYAPSGTANVVSRLSATGFRPSIALTITGSPGVPAGWTTFTPAVATDASGSVAIPVVSAAGTAPPSGIYSITVTDGTNTVTVLLTITAAGTSFFVLSPTSGVPGTTVSVIGFGASSTAINFDGVAQTATQCVGNTWPTPPSPAGSFNVPLSGAGVHSVTATGITGSAAFTNTGAPTISVVSPSSAAVGTTVTIIGSGFAKSATLGGFSIDGLTVTPSFVAFSATGAMVATFVVPAFLPTSHLISMTDSAANTATATFTSTVSSITITPTSGVVSWKTALPLLVTGSNFPMNQPITVTFAGAGAMGAVTTGLTATNTNGGILIYNTSIPATTLTPNGAHTVTVTAGTAAATATFTVNANITFSTTLNLNLITAVRAPAVVPISGAGFAANSALSITLGGAATTWYNTISFANTSSVLSDANGNIPPGTGVAVIIPAGTAPGSLAIAVTDASGNSATASLTILGTPSLSLGAAQGIAGVGQVTMTGSGYTPGARTGTVSIYQGTTLIQTEAVSPTVTAQGALPSFLFVGTTKFTVPNAPAGVYTVNLTLGTPTESAIATFTILGAPTLTTTPISGIAGTNVTLTVVGLSAISTATLGGSLATITPDTTTVKATGTNAYNLTTWFYAPAIPSGTYTLLLSDGPRSATSAFTINAALSLTIPAGGALKGTPITIAGTGFAPAGTAFNVTVNGALIAASAGTTTTNGNVSSTLTVPLSAMATGNVVVVTDTTGNTANATFAVAPPSITLNPTSGTATQTVSVIGTGFTPSAGIIIQVGGSIVNTAPALLAANSGGQFLAFITIPAGLSGNQTITAIDTSNNVATAVFAVSAGTGGTFTINQAALSSTAQTVNSAGQPATSFARGSTVKINFVLDTTTGSGSVVWRITLQQGTAVFNIATTTASVSTTPNTLSFSQLIPTTVSAGTWTASVQIFASDGVTPLAVTPLTFSVT